MWTVWVQYLLAVRGCSVLQSKCAHVKARLTTHNPLERAPIHSLPPYLTHP